MHLKQQLALLPTYSFKLLLLLGVAMACFQCNNASSVWLYIDNQHDSALSVTVDGEVLKDIPSRGHRITMIRPGEQVIQMKLYTTGKVDSVRIDLKEDEKYVLNPFRETTYYLGKVEYAKYSNSSGHNASEEEMINQMIFPVDVDYLLETPPASVEVWGNDAFARRKYLRRASDPNPHGPSQKEMAAFINDNKDLFKAELAPASGNDPIDKNDQVNDTDGATPSQPVITEKQSKVLQFIAEARLEEALMLQFGKSAEFTRHQEALKAAKTAYLADPQRNFEAYGIAHSKVSFEILQSVNGITPGSFDQARCLNLLSENKIEEATRLLIEAGYEMGAHQQLRYALWRKEIEAGRISEAATIHFRNRTREAIKGSMEMGAFEY